MTHPSGLRLRQLISLALGAASGLTLGYLAAQMTWVLRYLAQQKPERSLSISPNRLNTGLTYTASQETPAYTVSHSIENGIERVIYTPLRRRFQTPLFFQHGMWHGAWCWRWWQETFAAWGWESIAISLPGHAGSPEQRPISRCTLDYYLSFLKGEVERLSRKPILIGHSMGGALAQWYLKYVADDLPAAVLVAPWPHRLRLSDGYRAFFRHDPLGFLLLFLRWRADPLVRTPQSAARLLISSQAVIRPEELHALLGPESIIVLLQHLWHWQAPERVRTPLLILAGEADAMINLEQLLASAMHYQADFYIAKGAGHNLQMEYNYRETAEHVQRWLINEGIE